MSAAWRRTETARPACSVGSLLQVHPRASPGAQRHRLERVTGILDRLAQKSSYVHALLFLGAGPSDPHAPAILQYRRHRCHQAAGTRLDLPAAAGFLLQDNGQSVGNDHQSLFGAMCGFHCPPSAGSQHRASAPGCRPRRGIRGILNAGSLFVVHKTDKAWAISLCGFPHTITIIRNLKREIGPFVYIDRPQAPYPCQATRSFTESPSRIRMFRRLSRRRRISINRIVSFDGFAGNA